MLHVKSEDLRLYDITTDENSPVMLEDENDTLEKLGFDTTTVPKDGFKLLVESECAQCKRGGVASWWRVSVHSAREGVWLAVAMRSS